MWRSYLKIAGRNLIKRKAFSFINIVGLALGMAACLLILEYVKLELSYEDYHVQSDQIYRVQLDRYNSGELSTSWASGCAAIGPQVKANFPEVVDFARLRGTQAVVSQADRQFRETELYYANPAFLSMFTYPLVKGDAATALAAPYQAILTESMAEKYFGDRDPMGQTLRLNGEAEYEVTGIIADVPENTHLRFDMLLSWATFETFFDTDLDTAWQWDGFFTYLLLEEGTDPAAFEAKLPSFVEAQIGEQLEQYNAGMIFSLQPLEDIYLYSDLMYEAGPNGDGQAVYFLLIISLFIVAIAWINYVNLATARSMDRSKEVGVRKVMGSTQGQLIRQFLLESVLLNVVALAVALGVIVLALPSFSALTGKAFTLAILGSGSFWAAVLGLFAIGAFLSGLYPALVMAAFKPIRVLKSRERAAGHSVWLRKGLVVFQFAASVALMVGTFTVYQQIEFMREQDLGIDIEQTLVVRGPSVTDSTYTEQFRTFKAELLNTPSIQGVTASTAIPGQKPNWNAGGIRRANADEREGNQYRVIGVDYGFFDAFDIDVVNGRVFSEDFGTDPQAVLFNQSAVARMGFASNEEAIGEDIYFWGTIYTIVGVVEDYHQESLKETVDPLIFRLIPETQGYYSMKVSTENLPATLGAIEAEWRTFFPGNPFDYFFLDDHFDQQYRADLRFGEVFALFALLAIVVACLGLFGLASFMVTQRTKEIGIRKALGATVPSIVALLTQTYARLIVVAFLVALPVAYYVMDVWLMNFANRIDLSWWLFAVPGLVVLLIAVAAVSGQTIRAALANPVKSLRYE